MSKSTTDLLLLGALAALGGVVVAKAFMPEKPKLLLDDREALRLDMYAVGNDFRYSLHSYEQERRKRLR